MINMNMFYTFCCFDLCLLFKEKIRLFRGLPRIFCFLPTVVTSFSHGFEGKRQIPEEDLFCSEARSSLLNSSRLVASNCRQALFSDPSGAEICSDAFKYSQEGETPDGDAHILLQVMNLHAKPADFFPLSVKLISRCFTVEGNLLIISSISYYD
ncbi:hypothetical protein CHARACLAT_011641 [Characodon lateralis]|uniref:Uncharacterized protein n=1 Tax=Characodon lateralis TaxID=208331 RepID=A0ABU7CPT8_9TELE|nr:hypothetical protein [Characodon lateralis]